MTQAANKRPVNRSRSDFVSSRLGELHISRETKSEQEANRELQTVVLTAMADLEDRQ